MMTLYIDLIWGNLKLNENVKEITRNIDATSRYVKAWNSKPAIIGFVVVVLVIGIGASWAILAGNRGDGLQILLIIGAIFIAGGTLTQMTITWADPAGIREQIWAKEVEKVLDELVSDELKTQLLKSESKHIGKQFEKMRLVKQELKKANTTVKEQLADDVADLKRRKRAMSNASLGWALLSIGAIMVAANAAVAMYPGLVW